MMKKRYVFVGLYVVLCALLVSGCGMDAAAGTITPEVVPVDVVISEEVAEPEIVSVDVVVDGESDEPAIGMANPASVYCEEQGGRLDIRTDADGGQYGVCVFDDGTECEEWAFFRGECPVVEPSATTLESTSLPVAEGVLKEAVVDWVGFIENTSGQAQFDDYFVRSGYEGGEYGIDTLDAALAAQIEQLSSSGQQVHVWGTLLMDVPDYGGWQIVVTRLTVDEIPQPSEIVEKAVEDWVGVVVGYEDMAQFDDYFQMMDQNGQRFGLWGEGELGEQLAALRDTGTVIHVWGILRRGVPDAYSAQIAVTRIELE